jgi:hypothetical protein
MTEEFKIPEKKRVGYFGEHLDAEQKVKARITATPKEGEIKPGFMVEIFEVGELLIPATFKSESTTDIEEFIMDQVSAYAYLLAERDCCEDFKNDMIINGNIEYLAKKLRTAFLAGLAKQKEG